MEDRSIMKWFLLVIVVFAVGIGYWYWTTTPEYSLREARAAIKSHDLVKFQKYVDVESVASGMVDSFMAGPVHDMSGLGFVGRMLTIGLVGLVKPSLIDSVKEEILRLVEKGAPQTASSSENSPPGESTDQESASEDLPGPTNAGSGISLKQSLKTFGFKGKLYNGTEYSRREGKLAYVGLKLYNQKYNRDLTLEVKLLDMGGYWQVIGLPNLTQMLQTLVKLEQDYHGGQRIEKTTADPV